MKIDLSKYYLGPPDKTECRCGAKAYFLTQKPDVDEILPMFMLCSKCGEIFSAKPGGRTIISEGDKDV